MPPNWRMILQEQAAALARQGYKVSDVDVQENRTVLEVTVLPEQAVDFDHLAKILKAIGLAVKEDESEDLGSSTRYHIFPVCQA